MRAAAPCRPRARLRVPASSEWWNSPFRDILQVPSTGRHSTPSWADNKVRAVRALSSQTWLCAKLHSSQTGSVPALPGMARLGPTALAVLALLASAATLASAQSGVISAYYVVSTTPKAYKSPATIGVNAGHNNGACV